MFCFRVPLEFLFKLNKHKGFFLFGLKNSFFLFYLPHNFFFFLYKGFLYFVLNRFSFDLIFYYFFVEVFLNIRYLMQKLSFGFFSKLLLTGVGYRVFFEKFLLKFSIGYNSLINYKVSNNVFIFVGPRIDSRIIISFCSPLRLAKDSVESSIVRLRKLNSYKDFGFRYINQNIFFKVGKRV